MLAYGLALLPSSALAFPDEPQNLDETANGTHDKRFHLTTDIALHFGGVTGVDVFMLSPVFGTRVLFSENWILDAQWGFSLTKFKPDNDSSDTTLRPGSPVVSINYQHTKNDFSYRLGVGATVPVAFLPGNLNKRVIAETAYDFAAATRGNWDYFMWNPHTFSLVIPMKLERRKPSGFIWGVEADFGFMISINSKNDNNNAFIQLASNLGYQVKDWLRVGGRFQLVIIPKLRLAGVDERTQLSVEPYLRFGDADKFVTTRILINIDKPHGFSFDKNEVWGLRIGAGAAF